MLCNCGNSIQKERYEFLLEENKPLCYTECSSESRTVGLMDFSHKTAPALVILPTDVEQQRLAKRAFRRAR